MFWAMVTVPEPRQPRRPHDCTEKGEGSLHTQLSLYVTKCALRAYRAHVFQQTLLKELLAMEKVMKSARVQPWTHCWPPACLSWNCSSRFQSSFCLAHRLASSLQASRIVLKPGECRRCGATCLSSSCVLCHLLATELV